MGLHATHIIPVGAAGPDCAHLGDQSTRSSCTSGWWAAKRTAYAYTAARNIRTIIAVLYLRNRHNNAWQDLLAR